MTADIKDIRREIEPFVMRDAELSEFERQVGYKCILHIVGRDASGGAIDLETGAACELSDVWEIISQARLSRKRYHYLKRKGREQQLEDELNTEIRLALQRIAERVADVRELAARYSWKVFPVPQEVQQEGSSDAIQ